jgi:3-dehydroquinate synthetase
MSRRGKLVPHGACVALGMVHALRVSKQYFGFETRSIISELLEANILPTGTNLQEILSLPKDEILKLIQSDKKNDGNAGVQFILLEDWGKPRRGNNGRWQVEIPIANVASEIEMTFAFLNNQNRDES